uniref:Uncharacterized protein n=1 Tax=Anopheles atroparvus TaxID=41427 RepID=A0A182IQZ0_ANOAO
MLLFTYVRVRDHLPMELEERGGKMNTPTGGYFIWRNMRTICYALCMHPANESHLKLMKLSIVTVALWHEKENTIKFYHMDCIFMDRALLVRNPNSPGTVGA